MKNKIFPNICLSAMVFYSTLTFAQSTATKVLNGEWEMGFNRKYTQKVSVPSIASDPKKITGETLWYKKVVQLPKGNWKAITLQLKGARFRPELYVNGKLIGQKEGGMAPVFFELENENAKPGKTMVIEIALASLKNIPETDASYIPQSDQWRSNVSFRIMG
ncbi:hypothetical protein EZ428_08495 [Pedobacter frigiditerrae]|uniref:Glycosyl hydrolases family 2 sugar binding domain-containing protein n=1 Tax=Pedobacter frigiditerrae TaxID=2530452 RepID=A0A4R0MWY7_9SPHI|nr:hypothetical protein [Pedobacter frigiditerrae]TCC91781.1 hypothetical protein EZ428_08495 [Pedobacter frigiditerrae]